MLANGHINKVWRAHGRDDNMLFVCMSLPRGIYARVAPFAGKELMRSVRIYTNDGKMASTTTMAEKRVGQGKVQLRASDTHDIPTAFTASFLTDSGTRAQGASGLSYDSFN